MPEPQGYLPKGYILKEYRIHSVLGSGGFSTVYLAYHISTKARVVIKEYYPSDLVGRMAGGRVVPKSEEANITYTQGIKRFFNEANALAKVHHPNIVHVSDIFRLNNTVYMVMSYEQGTDLRWYIKRHSAALSQKLLVTVFPQLLDGVEALHKHNLLHLDIKPANILLRPGGRPLLLDFGAVQHYEIGSRQPWAQTLTMGFAPIEQHEKTHLGPWSDVYAIGATMYACISGKAPPAAPDRKVKDRYVPCTKRFGRRYARQILEGIDAALRMDYQTRPQSARAMRELTFPADGSEPPRPGGLFSYLKLPWTREPTL